MAGVNVLNTAAKKVGRPDLPGKRSVPFTDHALARNAITQPESTHDRELLHLGFRLLTCPAFPGAAAESCSGQRL